MANNTYIPLLIRQMNDAEKNLNRTIFDVPDNHLMQITACMKWTLTPTKRNSLNVNTFQNYLQVTSRITVTMTMTMVVMMMMMMMIYKGKVKHEEARKLNSFICFVAGVNGDKVGIM